MFISSKLTQNLLIYSTKKDGILGILQTSELHLKLAVIGYSTFGYRGVLYLPLVIHAWHKTG